MKHVVDLSAEEAKAYFRKASSYFNGDLPDYISFEPILEAVSKVLGDKHYADFEKTRPDTHPGVNYSFVANKDGRFAWRPYELIHPAIYVSLVNLICEAGNWSEIVAKIATFRMGCVDCCSPILVSTDHNSDQATQVKNWWHAVEQKSLTYSLEYSHILHTDVTDCYGSLYTHSIAWALHGLEVAKATARKKLLLGDRVDSHIRAGRYGQTNGISQGSVLMDFIAEIVLGYVDANIDNELGSSKDFRVLRYRDDYRIFANSDERAEAVLKTVSDKLRDVGMRLGVSKTYLSTNVVEGSVKADKLAGIELQDLGEANAKTIQKQLLRLHAFGRKFPNSGALRKLSGELHSKIMLLKDKPDDLDVQVAIATDIAVVSPQTFPAIAGILSHLISLEPEEKKKDMWTKVHEKMKRVPYNGYLQVWLQRVTKPKAVGLTFSSDEAICKVVNGEKAMIWENKWINSVKLEKALDVSKILVKDAAEISEVIRPEEVALFNENTWMS